MRTPREILFRLHQEARNLAMLASPPELSAGARLEHAGPPLPSPESVIEALRDSDFARRVIQLAGQICAHRFPLFGGVLETGPEIRWRRDYQRQVESGLDYFRLIPYLDADRAGDHKLIWELNRHQHLVVLAQAYLFTSRQEFVTEIAAQLESWLEQNPFLRGMNWVSALEVAFRSLSWTWVLRLAGSRLPESLSRRVMTALYRHGLFLEHNLSVYFSPNTHLLGEALALDALGRLFPEFPSARRWTRKGAAWMQRELRRQVREDGGHFEQSSYYHVYALDMFLFHAALTGRAPEELARMAEFLAAIMGPRGSLPFLGDDDGGRLFHPYGPRDAFGRATLATCGVLLKRPEWIRDKGDLEEQAAWWLGPRAVEAAPANPHSKLFPATGIAVMTDGEHQVVVDGGPFGPGRAGHSHSDTLNVIARTAEREILIDPGTFTYVGDAAMRDWFRGSAAHNTMRVDGLDQAQPRGPFGWAEPPAVRILDWRSEAAHDFVDAECRYRGIRHRRRVVWIKPDVLFVLDDLDGPPGEHAIEQFWHLADEPVALSPACFRVPGALLVLSSKAAVESAWRSPVYGTKIAALAIRAERREGLPSMWATALIFGDFDQPASLERTADGWILNGARKMALVVTPSGVPQYHQSAVREEAGR